MSGIFIAAPGHVPPPVASPWHGLTMSWTGWNGNIVSLTDLASGAFLVNSGVRGLNMPPSTRYTSTSPALAGSRFRGHVVDEREVFWPLYVYSETGSQDWLEHDRAVWSTLVPDRLGTWTVTQPNGTSRFLRCRFTDDGDMTFNGTAGPAGGWALYGVKLVAEQPYWEGAPVTQTWRSTGSRDFLPALPGDRFVVWISPGSRLTSARMTNPGDVETWPVWTVRGPCTTATLGVAGGVVTVPFALADGQWVVVDTNPDRQTAIDQDGVERTGELGEVNFAPIPPGEQVELSLDMAGSGSVSAVIQPRYWRAW